MTSDGPTGVLVVDKPAGMTSHDVVAVIRRAARQRRVGHTGTLDPGATGVLVLCLGRATRLVQYLQAGEKTYAAEVTFGMVTTTQDLSGEVIEEHDAAGLDEAAVRDALDGFRGDIEQVPPMVSALKVDGERLHEKARRGEVVEREPRSVTIHELRLESFAPGERATAGLTVTCSSGTYVRTLAHDLGRTLGVGAALAGLRRTANGPFTLVDAVPLGDLEDDRDAVLAVLHDPVEACRRTLPTVSVEDREAVRTLAHGGWLPPQGIEGPYAVLHEDALVGIYADEDGDGRPQAVLLRPEELGG